MSEDQNDSLFTDFNIAQTPANANKFVNRLPGVIIVDNFYENPDAVRHFAMQQDFVSDDRHFKGSRSKHKFLFPFLKEHLELILRARILNWLNNPYNGVFQVTTKDDPIVYHSDHQTYAAAVYLTPDAPLSSGTSFWKSKETGLRRPPTPQDAQRAQKSVADLERETYGGKLLDRDAWDLVDTVGNVYNRLAIWDGKSIHSAGGYFGDSIQNGRLIHLFFFDAELAV